MIQFGMPTLIENATLEENVALCRELGLKFIELNMNFPEYQVDQLEDTDRLIRIAEEAGIYYTIHLDENLNIADFNPLVSEAYLETVRRAIEVAVRLLPLKDKFGEASLPLTINMHMHHGIHITLPDRKVQMYDRDFATYMKAFTKFRDLCEEWIGEEDVKIVIENTEGFRGYEQKAIDFLLQSPKFGLTWDIGHSKAVKEIDVPFILARQDKLVHFHIHDGTEVPPKNHLGLGDGEIDLQDRLRTADHCNARCVLETKTIEALRKSVKWLRQPKRELGIARCGLACCLCSENITCKGCRQDGFLDLSWCQDAAWCEVRKCVLEQGIKGCYECAAEGCTPATCHKGLLADKIKPRAFAEYVRRYGMEDLLDHLERNAEAGIVYHREGIMGDYDDFDDIEALIEFIRSGK